MAETPLTLIEESLIAFADEVPPLFFRLRNLVENLHSHEGISAGGRAVLRDIVTLAPQSVPELAAMRSMTRQAVQPVIDDLVDRGLIAMEINPRHKRSPLWRATSPGATLFAAMRQREIDTLKNLAHEFSQSEIEASLAAIRFMSKALAGHFPNEQAQ
jgi:DNA-binding MarR family transcriptional regulator